MSCSIAVRRRSADHGFCLKAGVDTAVVILTLTHNPEAATAVGIIGGAATAAGSMHTGTRSRE